MAAYKVIYIRAVETPRANNLEFRYFNTMSTHAQDITNRLQNDFSEFLKSEKKSRCIPKIEIGEILSCF